ncbi:M15 family metallopeptidase [Paenibacillus rhizovicinus]|uniref:M15 family metallopeptidase n=1 Tax=Paenibacillus rhizovicinus TaxID=2704463 RepID=A0A6C0NU27_9BACL|nr:M15 family metallopeptidase [Paenibacillus rhizovicinus]QHW29678.1 M15 family metallopeptidase [Paenibacillus rhizovicinus]
MKTLLCVLAALLLITGCESQTRNDTPNNTADSADQDNTAGSANQDNTAGSADQDNAEAPVPEPEETGLSIHVKKEQIHEGSLLLIDREHAVPPGGEGEPAVNLYEHKELRKGFGLLDNTVRLSPDLTEKFAKMVVDAAKVGIDHFLISSGYRDEAEQNKLHKEMGDDRAMPAGHSEHNLGLSLDIGSSLEEMSEAPEGKWLAENAWKYGFIQRYPEDKTAITGIMYEPWHFRYVGLPHSAVMKEQDLTLEQYLAELKEHSISTTSGGRAYEIYYYPISADGNIQVPVTGSCEIDGNNEDGVIVTVDTGPEGGAK